MSDISEQLLDALIELPQVRSIWLKAHNRRGSHFSRADEDLFVEAPAMDEQQWALLITLVEQHEKWHLISVFKVDHVPVAGATRVRPAGQRTS